MAPPNMPRVVEVTGKVLLCDPANNRIEFVIKQGAAVSVFCRTFTPFFVWPQVGEYWAIRRENNDWVLGNRIQNPNNPTTNELDLGVAYAHAEAIQLSDGSNVNTTNGIKVKEGINAKQGVATLVAGQVVVPNTSVTSNSRIQLTSQQDGGTPGFLRVLTRISGTSFTIKSSSATDTSVVAYQISEPAT